MTAASVLFDAGSSSRRPSARARVAAGLALAAVVPGLHSAALAQETATKVSFPLTYPENGNCGGTCLCQVIAAHGWCRSRWE
jgi:hypothetical protein